MEKKYPKKLKYFPWNVFEYSIRSWWHKNTLSFTHISLLECSLQITRSCPQWDYISCLVVKELQFYIKPLHINTTLGCINYISTTVMSIWCDSQCITFEFIFEIFTLVACRSTVSRKSCLLSSSSASTSCCIRDRSAVLISRNVDHFSDNWILKPTL